MDALPSWPPGTAAVLCVAGPHAIPVSHRRPRRRPARASPWAASARRCGGCATTPRSRCACWPRAWPSPPRATGAWCGRAGGGAGVVGVELRVTSVLDHLADGRTEMDARPAWRWLRRQGRRVGPADPRRAAGAGGGLGRGDLRGGRRAGGRHVAAGQGLAAPAHVVGAELAQRTAHRRARRHARRRPWRRTRAARARREGQLQPRAQPLGQQADGGHAQLGAIGARSTPPQPGRSPGTLGGGAPHRVSSTSGIAGVHSSCSSTTASKYSSKPGPVSGRSRSRTPIRRPTPSHSRQNASFSCARHRRARTRGSPRRSSGPASRAPRRRRPAPSRCSASRRPWCP